MPSHRKRALRARRRFEIPRPGPLTAAKRSSWVPLEVLTHMAGDARDIRARHVMVARQVQRAWRERKRRAIARVPWEHWERGEWPEEHAAVDVVPLECSQQSVSIEGHILIHRYCWHPITIACARG